MCRVLDSLQCVYIAAAEMRNEGFSFRFCEQGHDRPRRDKQAERIAEVDAAVSRV